MLKFILLRVAMAMPVVVLASMALLREPRDGFIS